MNARWLLVFAIGCGSDDPPGGGGPVEQRAVFSGVATAPTTQLTFEGDATLQAGDTLIALIEANGVDDIELSANPGWTLLADDLAVMCINPFHVFVLTTTFDASTTFDFTFTTEDTFTAIVTAYSGASSADLLDFTLMGEKRQMQILYPATTLAPESVVWFGGAGQSTWSNLDTPIGPEDLPVTSVAAVGNAATFEFATADGAVPAIELPNDNGMCANVARLSVQP